MGKTVDTGIAALNMMLGGLEGRGIRKGSAVLLRGGPGMGKTTLAMQMIAAHARENGHLAVLISLETDPKKLIDYVNTEFGFDIAVAEGPGKPPEARTVTIDRKALEKSLQQWCAPPGGAQEEDAEALGDALNALIETEVTNQLGCDAADQIEMPTLIVVDSLNLLAGILLRHLRRQAGGEKSELRDALWIIWNAVQDFPREEAVILFTGEYDPLKRESGSVASESYFCDVDIQLSLEPVVREAAVCPLLEVSADDERCKTLGPRKGIEKRLFCRVLKARGGPKQSRRCTYDIVKHHGLRFYETYPGDGQIMLFAENEPQREEWKNFITHDVLQMYLYPALDHHIFDRGGLQRTFTSMRRFLRIPEATDMYLSSFDTYWVNWYVELYQRLAIVDLLSQQLECAKPKELADPEKAQILKELFCELIGKIQLVCTEALAKNNKRVAKGQVEAIIEAVCRRCPRFAECKYNNTEAFQTNVVNPAYRALREETKRCGLLHPIAQKEIRMFGERKSDIIPQLKRQSALPGPPYMINGKIFAVPYNANISFLVYRKDLLQAIRGAVSSNALMESVQATFDTVRDTCARVGLEADYDPKQIETAIKEIGKKFQKDTPYRPETWEEVIALCDLGSQVIGKELRFLIETRTFDTFACTLLEGIWSSGKDLRILPDYTIKDKEKIQIVLFRAYYILSLMFQRGIIPRDSCLEPEEFAAQSSTPTSEWFFARHWYSTLIDVLTATRTDRNGKEELVWKPSPDVMLEIMPIPLSLMHKGRVQAPEQAMHRSSWGEWYLGIMKGTENEMLAVDLINNLMSSRKVCDRASSCAALPTVQDFYNMYGDAACFNLPNRSSKLLPRTTYTEISELFKNAKSRTDIFDFRHCMRELLSVAEYVRMSGDNLDPTKLKEKIKKALERIEALGKKDILVCNEIEGQCVP